MDDDVLFTSIPIDVESSSISLFVIPSSLASSVILTFLLAKVQASVLFSLVEPPAHSCSLTTLPSAAWNCSSPVSSFLRHSPAA